jgi:hypothetical protein
MYGFEIFLIGIAILLIGFLWKTDFRKKQYLRNRHEIDKADEKIKDYQDKYEGFEQIKRMCDNLRQMSGTSAENSKADKKLIKGSVAKNLF